MGLVDCHGRNSVYCNGNGRDMLVYANQWRSILRFCPYSSTEHVAILPQKDEILTKNMHTGCTCTTRLGTSCCLGNWMVQLAWTNFMCT